MVGFADFLLFCFGLLYFFWLALFSSTRNSINSEKTFVFYSFRFMPAQLTRFGIDRNSAILNIAWRVILHSNFFLLQRRFFFRTTVLLGGSSVKKLTEHYDLTKLLCFGLCRYRLSIKSFSYPMRILLQNIIIFYCDCCSSCGV